MVAEWPENGYDILPLWDALYETADFARQLERELNAACKLLREAQKWMDEAYSSQSEGVELNARIDAFRVAASPSSNTR